MTRPVQIALGSPLPASTAAVNRLHDLGNGVIVVHPTPGRGGEGIGRDVLQALGRRFRDRTPRDPRRLQTLAAIWLRAELVRELVITTADRRPVAEWRVLRDLVGEAGARLTLVVERRPTRDQLAAVGEDVRELTLSGLVEELPPADPPDTWGVFDESGSPDDRPGYPPVPDVDFALFPSACVDLLPEHDAARVLHAFELARGATMLWLEFRCRSEDRHGPSPRDAHAFLDTLVAPCVTVDGAIAEPAAPMSMSASTSRSAPANTAHERDGVSDRDRGRLLRRCRNDHSNVLPGLRGVRGGLVQKTGLSCRSGCLRGSA